MNFQNAFHRKMTLLVCVASGIWAMTQLPGHAVSSEITADQQKILDSDTKDIDDNPGKAEFFAYRGNSYSMFMGHSKEAIADYSKAIEVDPKYEYAYLQRAEEFRKEQKYPEAVADYDAALKLKLSAEAFHKKAVILHFCLKQPAASLPAYSASIAIDPYDAEVYESRGVAESELAQYDKALKDLTRAIEINPRSDGPFMYRADVFEKTGQKDKAGNDRKSQEHLSGYRPLQFYLQSMSEDPDNIGIYFLLADKQIQAKQYKEALDTLTRAIALKNNYAEAYYMRGQCWEKLKNDQQAIDDFSAAISLDPTGAQAQHFKGSSFAERSAVYMARASLKNRSEPQQAINDYTTAISIDPDNMQAYLSRGTIYSLQKRPVKALADKNEAIKLVPKNPILYEARASTLEDLGQFGKAWDDYDRAVKIMDTEDFQKMKIFGDPKVNLASALRERGLVSLRLNRRDDGNADLKRALELEPGQLSLIEFQLQMLQQHRNTSY